MMEHTWCNYIMSLPHILSDHNNNPAIERAGGGGWALGDDEYNPLDSFTCLVAS